jgi:hypothetical protein
MLTRIHADIYLYNSMHIDEGTCAHAGCSRSVRHTKTIADARL